MFEEFYEMYETEEQEVVALINRCIGGGFNWKGNFWEMTVVTLGIVSCDTGKVSTKEERLDWPVTDEERHSDKGWGRFQNEQICRLKIRRMKEEWAKDLVVQPWCISEVVKAHEDCPELQAVLDEYHKPVVIQDQVLGELTLDKDYDTFEGEIQWCGKDVSLSLEVNAESKPSWTRARSAAKKLLADCDTWDKAMRELAAKNLIELANNWLSQDEENPRNPETDPITEDELARRISLTSLSVTSGGSFTAWFDCDEMFTDHAVTVYGSLKKGLKTANIEEPEPPMKLHEYWLGLHPLDWEFCFMPVQTYKNFITEQYHKNPTFYNISAGSIEKVLAHIDVILSAAMEDWNNTTNHAALRCPPMIFPLPKGQDSNTAEFAIILKMDNDGDTVVYSPIPLPHLENQ